MAKRRGQRLRDTYDESRKMGTVGGSYDSLLPRETLSQKGREYLDMSDEEALSREEEVRAYAKDLLERGAEGFLLHDPKSGNVKTALLGASLYEKIGKGKKAIPKLLKAARREELHGKAYGEIEDFVERNAGDQYQGQLEQLKRGVQLSRFGIEHLASKGLEGKLPAFLALTIGGAALSLGSLTITGNAVSNLTRTTPGLLGIILFIAGLTGLFFYFKKR